MKTKYRQNNLLFRVASADAISKFKAIQAHSFLQAARKEINLSRPVKEVVLAAYDRFSKWILEAEYNFLDHQENEKLGPKFAIALSNFFIVELDSLEHTIDQHEDVFTDGVAEYVHLVAAYSKTVFAHKIKSIESMLPPEGFQFFVDEISGYLQHLLLSLYEFDNNVIKKKPAFLNVSCIDCSEVGTEMAFNGPLGIRARYFKNHGGITLFVVKNYISRCNECAANECEATLMTLVSSAEQRAGIKCAIEENHTVG